MSEEKRNPPMQKNDMILVSVDDHVCDAITFAAFDTGNAG
jgi:hypothetical protein